MLTEHYIASVGVPTRASTSNLNKDAGIFLNEYQPLNAQKTVFKKSVTPPNCLAISSTHVFAAQADKAVVHVYNREKGNQEAIVPFTERITCITLACNETVLALGTAEGRIFLWEVSSGRQITTAQSHLQALIALVVDPTSNFLLSASGDSTVHVWSLPQLLSFSNAGIEPPSPLRTFTSHNASISDLAVGHCSGFCNIAVTVSSDRICLVWDYPSNRLLRTFLLPSAPLSLALDPADRAIYVGYEDGSVQQLDLFASAASVAEDTLTSAAPIQPPHTSIWRSPDSSLGATHCLSVSFDGNTVLSGHHGGMILVWHVPRRGSPTNLLQAAHPGPVTNISFLPVGGFTDSVKHPLRIPAISKPKFGAFDTADGSVPDNYAMHAELASDLSGKSTTAFEQALYSPSFPVKLIDEGLNELLRWGKTAQPVAETASDIDEDFMALDGGNENLQQISLAEQNASLKAELQALRRLQKASFDKIDRINAEKKALLQREQKRTSGSDGSKRLNGTVNPNKFGNSSAED